MLVRGDIIQRYIFLLIYEEQDPWGLLFQLYIVNALIMQLFKKRKLHSL